MKRIKAFFMIFLFCFMPSGCSRVEEKTPVRISLNVWPGYAHAFIAERKGFFKKNRVDVELILVKSYSESTGLYKNGEVDGIFCVFSDVIMMSSEGIKARVVYTSDYSDSGDVIIGRPEFNSLADLRGKTVGFETVNSFSHMFVLKALEKAGLSETDSWFKNVPARDVLQALEKKEIDAGHSWEPITTQALKNGYKVIGKAGDIPGLIMDVLAFNENVIKKRPEDIKGIVKSMLEAADFIDSNGDEAMEIMSRATGMYKEEIGNGIAGIKRLYQKENAEAMRETGETISLYFSGAMISSFFLKRGQLSLQPDFGEVIEPEFIRQITGQ